VCALMGRLGIPRHQGTVGSAWMGRSPFAGRYGQHPAFAVRPAYPEREFPTPVESRRPFPGLGGRSEGTRGDGKPMHEAGCLAAFYGLAVLDCTNPSAMLVTLYLLQRSKPVRTVTAYMAGVYTSYFVVGVLLVLGIDALLTSYGDALSSPGAYAVQAVLGALMLWYSFKPVPNDAGSAGEKAAGAATLAALFGLGTVVTVVELTTAFPYLAATGILTLLQWPAYRWLAALALYNLIFVAPPFALLLIHEVLGRRAEGRLAALRGKLQRASHEVVMWIIGIIGFYI